MTMYATISNLIAANPITVLLIVAALSLIVYARNA